MTFSFLSRCSIQHTAVDERISLLLSNSNTTSSKFESLRRQGRDDEYKRGLQSKLYGVGLELFREEDMTLVEAIACANSLFLKDRETEERILSNIQKESVRKESTLSATLDIVAKMLKRSISLLLLHGEKFLVLRRDGAEATVPLYVLVIGPNSYAAIRTIAEDSSSIAVNGKRFYIKHLLEVNSEILHSIR